MWRGILELVVFSDWRGVTVEEAWKPFWRCGCGADFGWIDGVDVIADVVEKLLVVSGMAGSMDCSFVS